MDMTKLVAQLVAILAAVTALLGIGMDIDSIKMWLDGKAAALAAVYVAVQAFLPSVQELVAKVKGTE